MRLLTKSRYKLALECPNKLFYTRKEEYANQKNNDPFLQALASGGFQVEELARLHYPDGILIDGNIKDYDWLAKRTEELLQEENVTIFEAAFRVQNLFIRTDILVKKGNHIQLIEVKAKSFHPEEIEFQKSTWKPYLFDVAFQKYVIQKYNSNWSVTAYFMLADKSKTTTINGLNQYFRITRAKENRTGIETRIDRLNDIANESVLTTYKIEDYIYPIETSDKKLLSEYDFEQGIKVFAESYERDEYFNYPLKWGACKKCEFRTLKDEEENGKLSGFKKCWERQKGWTEKEFQKPNMFDVWDFKRPKLFNDKGIIFKENVTQEDIGYKKDKEGQYSRTERQWIQISKDLAKDKEVKFLKKELKDEMSSWKYPLNFIDFETSTAALPFYAGRKPYEQIAFQFSHHIYHEDGRIEHASEYINTATGEFPNFKFVRALKAELKKNNGSVFKYSNHENTILNKIYEQLWDSNEVDREELMDFIKNISHSTNDSVFNWKGVRDMIDLCEVIKKYYYNPFTNGSNSIKKVLPAIFEVSPLIRNKYSKPLADINITSKNFDTDKVWLNIIDGKVQDPYDSLPKPFEEWNEDFEVISELEELQDGGAALTAYGKIQYTDMSEQERELITKALLKYCELDTLAMVMIYEHLNEATYKSK